MSLIRPGDSSSTSYDESKIYGHKNNSENSTLSGQILASDKRIIHKGPDCYRSGISLPYFTNSSPGLKHVSACNVSPSSIQGTVYHSQASVPPYKMMANSRSITPENQYSSCIVAIHHPNTSQYTTVSQASSSRSDSQSLENQIDYDEDAVRSKLREIEQVLLNDNDDDLIDPDQEMEIDEDWIKPIKNLLHLDSPKESSSDSNSSSTDTNKEMRTHKQMLFDCAAAILDDNTEEASTIISELRQMVSIRGDPPERLAAYLVEGLAARMASSGQGLYKALRCKDPPTSDRLSAMQILFEVCPCFKFGFMAANGAIVEACKGEERVHIIDFDINQGSQYITLIQALSTRPTKPLRLRITGVDDPESVKRTVGGLTIIGQRLERLAEDVRVPFEFRAIAAKTGEITPSILDCKPDEALVVNFTFQLHHMPDESVSTVNQRDKLLRMVKGLRPKLVTLVEQDVNTNTAPFFPRFVEVYNYYSAVFDSLDATLPRESADRMNVERQCLARDIVNIVACEGEERIERYEVAGKWRARMTMAGFISCPLSSYVNGAIRSLLKPYCKRYMVKEEGGALYFGWEEKNLVVASAWK